MLTTHTCPIGPNPDNEELAALLWEALSEVPILIGELDICVHVSSVIVRPLARQLMIRRDDLLSAMEAG